MKTLVSVSVLVSLAAGASAQATNTLPQSAATTNPGNWSSSLFYASTAGPSEGRTQVLYAATDVLNSGLFRSLAVRRPANLGNQNVASTYNLQIDMSASSVAHLSAVPTYASNHGASVVTVFNGPVNLPANSSGTWPRPWEAPFMFTAPFVFIAAANTSLCVEFISSGVGATQIWYAEGATANTGAGFFTSSVINGGCTTSGGGSNNSIGWNGQPTIGTTWGPVSWSGLPENNPSWNSNALLLGFQGPGGMIGPFTLPVLLSALGLPPANAACVLANDIAVTLPLTYVTSTTVNAGSLRLAPLTLPNDPTLAGGAFYTQPLALDIGAAGPKIWTGWSGKWTIGDGIRRGLPLTQVSRIGANANATGTVATYTGPTILIGL